MRYKDIIPPIVEESRKLLGSEKAVEHVSNKGIYIDPAYYDHPNFPKVLELIKSIPK